MSDIRNLTIEEIQDFWLYDATKGELTIRHLKLPTGRVNPEHGYLVVRRKTIEYLAHRVAWACHYGEYPPQVLDHINGDRTDNRIENLRPSSPLLNSLNRVEHRNGKTPYIFYNTHSWGIIAPHSHKVWSFWGYRSEEAAKAVLAQFWTCNNPEVFIALQKKTLGPRIRRLGDGAGSVHIQKNTGKWAYTVLLNHKQYYLGAFNDKEAALGLQQSFTEAGDKMAFIASLPKRPRGRPRK